MATSLIRAIAAGAIVVAIPVLLVSTAVRAVVLSEDFYLEEFEKYGVGRTTGLPASELQSVARAFIDYFQAPPGVLRVELPAAGGGAPLFNQRELLHMEDVQAIMHRALAAGPVAFAGLLLGSAALLLSDRAAGLRRLARVATVGGAAAVGLVGLLALGALLDFGQLFLLFHFVSFANDLWILDPARDRLIQLFPQGFFFEAALRIGALTIAGGLAIVSGSLFTLWATRPRA